MARKTTPEFQGTDRYEIRRTLGVGGMGVVYEAYDRERGVPVALKTLRKVDPSAIYRFKREFRAIVDANHPNLVRLYELVQDDKSGRFFFTMEMVAGVDFLRWVGHETWPGADTRTGIAHTSEKHLAGDPDPVEPEDPSGIPSGQAEPTGAVPPINATEDHADGPSQVHTEVTRNWQHGESTALGLSPEATAPTAEQAPVRAPAGPVLLEKRLPRFGRRGPGSKYTPARVGFDGSSLTGLDIPRLRSALRQLVEGIAALHSIGCLHRDIKPSNVLITGEGRLVLLDLGLVTMMAPAEASIERYVAGTAAYMSPEQAMARTLSEKSDWYSVGVMLHEALTGSRPFRGRFEVVIKAKQGPEPPPPSHFADGVPPDLDQLCVDLLKKRPGDRPTGEQILARLLAGEAADPGTTATAARLAPVQAGVRGAPFVGREDDLEVLRAAYRLRGSGRAVAVHLTGASGLGKSALLRRFLDEVTINHRAVVVIGRCYATENVPFKALDGVIDSLSRHLRSLRRTEVEAVLPRGVASLARLFPVLRQVEAVAATPGARGPTASADDHERAFAALRELIARIAERRPLVVAVDDLQWGDGPGLQVLGQLTRGEDPPRILLVLGYRTDTDASAPGLLDALRADHGLGEPPDDAVPGEGFVRDEGSVFELRLGRLKPGEAGELALRLIGGDHQSAWADAVEAESAGNPLFVQELVRWTLEAGDGATGPEAAEPVRLEDVLRSRVAALSTKERALLDVVAVAGRPLRRDLALGAAQLDANDIEAVQGLLGAHMIRTRGGGDAPRIEVFHARIREVALAEMPPSRLRGVHLALARGMEALAVDDPEALTEHACGAGLLEEAGAHAVTAARRAAESGAFDRAAMFFRLSLRLRPVSEAERSAVRRDLAAALAAGGRGGEAAEEYLTLAATADSPDPLRDRRAAAFGFLDAGRVREAARELRGLAHALELEVPQRRRVVRRSTWMRRLRSVLGGDASTLPREGSPGAEERLKVDVLGGLTTLLRVVDPPQAMLVSERRLDLARAIGDRGRWGHAAAEHASLLAGEGAGNAKAVAALVEGARAALDLTADPVGAALLAEAEADRAREDGRWAAALDGYEEALERLHEATEPTGWAAARAAAGAARCELALGRLHALRARLRAAGDDADARGDRVHRGALRTGLLVLGRLALDDALTARADVASAMEPFRNDEYLLPNFLGGVADTLTDLYVGDAPEAWRRAERNAERLAEGSLVTRRGVAAVGDLMRARVALAAAEIQLRAAAGDPIAAHLLAPPPTPVARPTRPLPPVDELLAEVHRIHKRLERTREPWVAAEAALLRAGERALGGDRDGAVDHLRRAVSELDALGMGLHAAVARRRLAGLDPEAVVADVEAHAWFDAQGVVDAGRLADVLAPGLDPRPAT